MSRDVPDGNRSRPPDGPRAGSTSLDAGGLTLVVATLLVVVAGCGGGGGSSSTASSSPGGSTSARTTTAPTGTSTGAGSAEGLPRALGSPRAVRAAVEAVLTASGAAEACGKYVTDRYLTVAYGGKQGCVQAQRPGSAARSLKSFGIVQEAGQGALVRAKAVPSGGPYDGTTVNVGLVFRGDHYSVDRLHANVPVGP